MTGLAWTLDGASLVVGSPNGLWRVPVTTGRAEPALVAGIERAALRPSISRSGRDGRMRLAYEFLIQDVNIWRFDRSSDGTGRSRPLPGSTLWDDFPALSPDGGRIAFVSNRTGEIAIWTADADGSRARQLTFHRGVAVAPQWSPDGTRIAFALQSSGNWDIYVIGADGAGSSRLSWEPSQEENPSWSRDGRWIYFRSDRSERPRVWKMPSSGGAAVPVTAGEASQAFESVDGRLLYFVRSDNAPGLWSMPINGGAESFVLEGIRQHAWSLVDNGIVFIAAHASGAAQGIWSFDMRTRARAQLMRLPGVDRSSGFSASRDGRTVLWAQSDMSQSDVMVIDNWTP
jgi:Tol biopolymer transport system component